MGILNAFRKAQPKLLVLPAGSFTVDRTGTVLVRTLPSAFPEAIIEEIAAIVTNAFKEARDAQVPLTQLDVTYPNFRITARELRGGAMVFLSPKML